jgi:hypothetical protein
VTEWEIAEAPLIKSTAFLAERFTQDICWRSNWKDWLSMRPEVWTDYEASFAKSFSQKTEAVMTGRGPIAVMNSFTKELQTRFKKDGFPLKNDVLPSNSR